MNRWVAALIGLAFVLRLVWTLHLPVDDSQIARLPDQREYLDLGRNLLQGRGLVFHDPRFDADVFAYRTPGYPIFIAMCGGSIRIVRLVQAAIDTCSVLAVFLLARWWLSFRRSLLAAILVALNPLQIYFAGLILAETLFTALLVWGMVLISLPRKWVIGCLLLAIAVMVRPSALLLPIVLAGLNPAWPWAYQWRRAAVATGILLLLLIPWAWRNDIRLGIWIWTSTNGGITMYDGFNPSADGSSDQAFVKDMRFRTMDEVERDRLFSGMARNFILDHPARAVELTFAKLLRTWSPIPLSREYGHDLRYVLAGLFYTLPLFAMTAAGIMSNRLPMAAKMFLLIPAIYITLVHAASVGSIRYRVPADVPMAAVAAAAGSANFRRKTEAANSDSVI